VPLIPSRQCAAFIEKSELTTGGSLPLCPVPCQSSVRSKPGLGVRTPLDDDNPSPDGRVYPTQES
jgi:hypothetical protein